MTDVSVVLPCYNGARWISRAIESILAQTYESLELVIVDDGSADDSKRIISSYLYDERIRYIYQENRGFSAAINRGIKESNGIFIGFIGQDDLWMPIKLESQLGYINKHKNIDLLHSNYYSIDTEERTIRLKKPRTPAFSGKEEVIKGLFLNNFIGFETVLVRRKCFDEVGFFDEHMMGFSDHDMWLRIAGSFNIGHLDLPLVKKREHELQLSKFRADAILRDEFLMVKKAIEYYPFLKRVEHKKLISLYYSLGMALVQKGKYKKAKRELVKVIAYEPWKLAAIFAFLAPSVYNFMSDLYGKIGAGGRYQKFVLD